MKKKKPSTLAELSLHTPNPAHLRAQQQLRAHIFKSKKAYTRKPKHQEKY